MATTERVRAWVREDFGVELASIDAVGYGADEAAQLWRGTSVDGSRYAVKLTGGGTPAGLVVSAHLAKHGVPGVAAPVPTRDGRLCSERAGRRLSIVPWVSDDRALGGGMSDRHWASYGVLLAKVHATPVTGALAEVLPCEEHVHERVASTVRALDRRLRGSVDEPVDEPGDNPVDGPGADDHPLVPWRSGGAPRPALCGPFSNMLIASVASFAPGRRPG